METTPLEDLKRPREETCALVVVLVVLVTLTIFVVDEFSSFKCLLHISLWVCRV